MSDDVPEERAAIRNAVLQTAVVRAPLVGQVDVYDRDARAILPAGISRADAIDRVTLRMGLKPTEETTDTIYFPIECSNTYSALLVHLQSAMVTGYSLLSG